MGWNQDRAELEQYINQLKTLLGRSDLSADARVTGLAALIHARATTMATEALDVAEGDIAIPLATALHAFAEKADLLSARLGRLPEY